MKKKIFIIGLFIIGLGVFLYPHIMNYKNNIVHYTVIENYKEDITNKNEEEINDILRDANKFNQSIKGEVREITDPFENNEAAQQISEYTNILGSGAAIGFIEIPKIDAELPIYKGVSDSVLNQGVGHMPSTSLPVGGIGTHSVLTAHRGLPTAEMFRHLDKMERGDQFYIHTINGVLAYEVDQISVVLPYETDKIKIEDDQDFVTLVTCEPYMINTHRMLVRGKRVPYDITDPVNDEETSDSDKNKTIMLLSSLGLFIVIFIITFIWKKRKTGEDE